jgi:hypothetical protein
MATRIVKETDLGVYIALSAGIPIDDDEGHVLCIQSREGDTGRIREVIGMARGMGYGAVTVHFIPGVRTVSDDEFAIQQARLEAGMLPDPYEIGSALDAYYRETNKK